LLHGLLHSLLHSLHHLYTQLHLLCCLVLVLSRVLVLVLVLVRLLVRLLVLVLVVARRLVDVMLLAGVLVLLPLHELSHTRRDRYRMSRGLRWWRLHGVETVHCEIRGLKS
jgi:hypothetical protein